MVIFHSNVNLPGGIWYDQFLASSHCEGGILIHEPGILFFTIRSKLETGGLVIQTSRMGMHPLAIDGEFPSRHGDFP